VAPGPPGSQCMTGWPAVTSRDSSRGLAVGGHRGLRCTIILVTGAIGPSRSAYMSRWPIGLENATICAKPIGASPSARGRPSAGPIFHRTYDTLPIWRIRLTDMNQAAAGFVLRCKYRP
jgi:hypothetical protein